MPAGLLSHHIIQTSFESSNNEEGTTSAGKSRQTDMHPDIPLTTKCNVESNSNRVRLQSDDAHVSESGLYGPPHRKLQAFPGRCFSLHATKKGAPDLCCDHD